MEQLCKGSPRIPSAAAFAAGGWHERFWAMVDKRDAFSCWPWIGGTTPNGYGAFRLGKGSHHASRVSLALKIGRWPERHEFACHSCDNPVCVNPDHLWLGDSAANTRDAARKGRTHKWAGSRRGEKSPNAKLSERQAREIQALKGRVTMAALCERYGVSSGAIGAIWRGKSWTHLDKPEATHD